MNIYRYFFILLLSAPLFAAGSDDVVRPADRDHFGMLAPARQSSTELETTRNGLQLLTYNRNIDSPIKYEKLISALYHLEKVVSHEAAKQEIIRKRETYEEIFFAKYHKQPSRDALSSLPSCKAYVTKLIQTNKAQIAHDKLTEFMTVNPEVLPKIQEYQRQRIEAELDKALQSPEIQRLLADPLEPEPQPKQKQKPEFIPPAPQPPVTQQNQAATTPQKTPPRGLLAPIALGTSAVLVGVYGWALFKEYKAYCETHSQRSLDEQNNNPLKNKWVFFQKRFIQLKLSLSDATRIGALICAATAIYQWNR